ncbi:MAG: hypothetical protein CVU44_19695 [Chloroflexi bacterium HGW-Chloroflexi-6]|nr:MAG: hypothetical protein CVU44_19695 [Chloroflexi bacterium HGW-Chloroflexi-6]
MTSPDETGQSAANLLCKACGLCCSGHLFIWVKLRPAELDPAQALGMQVYRSDPSQRGFNQPCPLWLGQCTIYTSKNYPHACRAYKCKLLKEVIAEKTTLPDSLTAIEQTKNMIRELEPLLPALPNPNFRERLVARIERPQDFAEMQASAAEFGQKAAALLDVYEKIFGVNDLLEKP